MTYGETSMDKLKDEADRLGKEQEALDERNRKRRLKGRKPLPDLQERKDMEVLRHRPRTGGPVTVSGEDAVKLFEMRKAAMSGNDDDFEDDGDGGSEGYLPKDIATTKKANGAKQQGGSEADAVRAAAAARRVQDMKNGRIDHDGNWSKEGQRLEHGDETSFPASGDVWRKHDGEGEYVADEKAEEGASKSGSGTSGRMPSKKLAKGMMPAAAGLNEFKEDLYERLRVSFEALETTLSDLQGRVAEIVTATTPPAPAGEAETESGWSQFKELLDSKVPVVFDVEGTKMTFDAITVFHAPPCITVVSRSDSATIMPKPGARLKLTYEMDGKRFEGDPVTFLGTRFSLPMFGLSFVGFIRDKESDLMDVADA